MSFKIQDLQDSLAALLATTELLAPSMNGRSSDRLAAVLDDLRLDYRETFHPDAGPAVAGQYLTEHDRDWLSEALDSVELSDVHRWQDTIAKLAADDVQIMTCTDDLYPHNLRLVHNRPPILFVRGDLSVLDRRAIAVVGARKASPEGLELSAQIARHLSEADVTVVSGLAKGIDAAAHRAAIDSEGRTLAVFGTPIDRTYPAAHKSLADEVARNGACLSQFLPSRPTGPWSFPARNVVTSALSLGSVIVEASDSSGAKSQANSAIKHGKSVYLVESLVLTQDWAREMAEKQPDAHVVSSLDQIVESVTRELGSLDGLLL